VLAVVRESKSQGWSLVNAFEMPAQASAKEGLVEQSVRKLCEAFDDHLERYGRSTVRATAVMADRAAKLGLSGSVAEVIAKPQNGEGSFEALVRNVIAALN
jgi:hypothetical protein